MASLTKIFFHDGILRISFGGSPGVALLPPYVFSSSRGPHPSHGLVFSAASETS